MFGRRGLRLTVALAAAAAIAIAGSLAFGPVVRWRVAVAAHRRGLKVGIASVRPILGGFRLAGTSATLEGVEAMSLTSCDVAVRLGWNMRAERVDLVGCTLNATGERKQLLEQLKRWRSRQDRDGPGRPSGPVIRVRGGRVVWGGSQDQALMADGIVAELDALAGEVSISHVMLSDSPISVALSGVRVLLGPSRRLQNVSVEEGALTWSATDSAGDVRATTDLAPSPAAPQQDAVSDPTTNSRWAGLRSLKTALTVGAQLVTTAWDAGGGLDVHSLTLSWDAKTGAVPLTIGPGRASATLVDSAVDFRFLGTPGAGAAALTVRATLPASASDAVVSLEGGPIALAQLGVREGAAGLVDVANAKVAGRARVVLAGDGSALTFDGEGTADALAIDSSRIASDVVRGLALQVRARGVLSTPGDLRVDEFAASLGTLQLNASGFLSEERGQLSGALRFEVPTASCQSMLDGLPRALVPTLQGSAIAGTFGVRGDVRFDARALDDLELRYEVRDECRITSVPPAIDPDQFHHSFAHRVYLPDGTSGEQVTGPGEPSWTPLDEISPYMQVAVLTTEDGAFLRHHGFSPGSVRASLIANIKARRFIRGASTITMQLAKNLFLTREKTLSRKLEEVVLAELLEQRFSKDEIMELYLNVIEFGPAIYGITSAAEYYFGRPPAELNLAECMFLSSLLPSPIRYGAMRERGAVPEHWMRLIRSLMESAHRHGMITADELTEGESETIVFWNGDERPTRRAPVRVAPNFDPKTDTPSSGPVDAPIEP